MIHSLNNAVSHKLSILDAVFLSGVKTSPILQMLKSKNITSYLHSWIVDTYLDAKDNANPEISGLGATQIPTKQKTDNVTQILKSEIMVSKRQQDISQYGGKELEYQRAKKAIEHAKDIEYALLGLGNKDVFDKYTRSDDAERKADRMAGFFYFVPDANRKDFADKGAPSEFTYKKLCEILEPVWEKGGIDNGKFKIFLGSALKARVNSWIEKNPSMRIKNEKGEFNPLVDTIITDFGAVEIVMHRLFSNEKLKDKVLCGNFDESTICYLTPTSRDEVSTDKTNIVERFYTDCTLEVTNAHHFASGKGLN